MSKKRFSQCRQEGKYQKARFVSALTPGTVWRNNRATIIAASLVGILIVGSLVLIHLLQQNASMRSLVARVHASDNSVYILPLGTDDRLRIETDLGTNVIVVEQGSVRMAEADCPRGDCMREHAISRPGEQIICLPHQLWIEIVAQGEDGAQGMDTHAVSWDNEKKDTNDTDLLTR